MNHIPRRLNRPFNLRLIFMDEMDFGRDHRVTQIIGTTDVVARPC
jgi:hypothetical protein